MPDLITQFKQNGQSVSPAEYNELVAGINTVYNQAQSLLTNFNQLQALSNRFLAIPGTGLNVTIPGGVLRRQADGSLLTLGNLSVPVSANITNQWITILSNGTPTVSVKRPRECYPVAQVTTNATGVTSLTDRRSLGFEIAVVPLRKVIHAVKNTVQNIMSGGAYQTVTSFKLEAADGLNENGILNLATGIITIPMTLEYQLFTRVQVTTTTNANLSSKIGLFVGSTELRILDERDVSGGATRVTLSGEFEGQLTQGDQVSVRVSVGLGSNLTIPANNNTEIILKAYG